MPKNSGSVLAEGKAERRARRRAERQQRREGHGKEDEKEPAAGSGESPAGRPAGGGDDDAAQAALFGLGFGLPGRGTVCRDFSPDGSDYFYLRLGSEWQLANPRLAVAAEVAYAGSANVTTDRLALDQAFDAMASTDKPRRPKLRCSFYSPPAPVGLHVTIRGRSDTTHAGSAGSCAATIFGIVVILGRSLGRSCPPPCPPRHCPVN